MTTRAGMTNAQVALQAAVIHRGEMTTFNGSTEVLNTATIFKRWLDENTDTAPTSRTLEADL